MAWVNEAATTLVAPVNEAAYEPTNLTLADMDIPISEGEGTLGYPRSPWKNESASASVITNESANA